MPTKGARRANEAITLTPSSGYAPVTQLDAADSADGARPLGGGWHTDDHDPHSVLANGPTSPEHPRPPGDAADTDGSVPASTRPSRRVYRSDNVIVELNNVTDTRQQARDRGVFVTDTEVDLDGQRIQGELAVTRRRGSGYGVSAGAAGLSCTCGAEDCEHRRAAVAAVSALVNGSRVRSALGTWERTSNRAAEVLAQSAHASAESLARDPRPDPDAPAWDDDNTAPFQHEYEAARARAAAGEPLVSFMRENATAGLGARDGGRGFGVEIEFDLAGVSNRAAALRAIGQDLYAAGITTQPVQTGYHHGRAGYSTWRFERDSTVDGEIVSPILYDEPDTWDKIARVCEIVKRHGGTATARTGGHVHVGCADYDHTVENHNRLLGLAQHYEDTIYRLAQNPARRAHRGMRWCQPNTVASAGYRSISDVRANHASHGIAMNFEAVAGNRTDHVEYRMWDGTLDPAVIQTQVKLSLAMTEAAFRRETPIGGRDPVGTHRQANSRLPRGQRLGGEEWKADTRSFRQLVDQVFWREADKRQAAALFAGTRWQRRG